MRTRFYLQLSIVIADESPMIGSELVSGLQQWVSAGKIFFSRLLSLLKATDGFPQLFCLRILHFSLKRKTGKIQQK